MTHRQVRSILAVLLAVQLVLLTAQVPDPGGAGSRLEGLALRAVAPLAHWVAVAARFFGDLGHGLVLRRTLVEENRRLREQLQELRRQRVRFYGLEEEIERLSAALEYAGTAEAPLRVADVVYMDHASWLQTLVIHVGAGQPAVNQPVVAPAGLVGRVVLVAGRYAKVQLVTDRAASVGAMIARTRRQGIAQGGGGGTLTLQFVPVQADVRPGDRVVTAGIDGVYPRGLPVGTVTAVEPGDDLFHEIRLTPAVDFGLLDQVYIMGSEPVPEELKAPRDDARP